MAGDGLRYTSDWQGLGIWLDDLAEKAERRHRHMAKGGFSAEALATSLKYVKRTQAWARLVGERLGDDGDGG
jgi:hypothetical protein